MCQKFLSIVEKKGIYWYAFNLPLKSSLLSFNLFAYPDILGNRTHNSAHKLLKEDVKVSPESNNPRNSNPLEITNSEKYAATDSNQHEWMGGWMGVSLTGAMKLYSSTLCHLESLMYVSLNPFLLSLSQSVLTDGSFMGDSACM